MEWMQREHSFSNGLDEIKTRRILHLLKKLYNSITDEVITVSVSHGDFTPWNMYSDAHRLYVYDWELSSNGIPMLFDLYHFIIQSQVLIYRKSYSEVRKQINAIFRTPEVQRICGRYKLNASLHYRLYLLFTVSYYVRIYIGEKELLNQSHWLINLWLEALEDVHDDLR
jgi:hypothetical protein